jgi:L-asparaginase
MARSRLPKILVIGFGGTWCMQPRAGAEGAPFATRRVAEPLGSDFDFSAVFPQVPRFCEPHFEELAALDSSNLTPSHWGTLAQYVWRRAGGPGERFDGVVILQGTDTLAYTAAAMSFALRGLELPVVLSGAQIAVDALGSDAAQNVVNACRVAALERVHAGRREPALRRVAVVFGSQVIDGVRCRKMSENDLDAFASINAPPLGTIRREIELRIERARLSHREARSVSSRASHAHAPRPARRSPERARSAGSGGEPPVAGVRGARFDEDVALIQLYPGIRPEVLDAVAGRASGLVLAAFGAGNVPSSAAESENPLSLEAPIRRAVERGVPVVVTTQCPTGLAEPGLYDAGARARAAGAIVANDMTTETAFVKLAWLLAAAGRPRASAPRMRALRRQMLTPLLGEITPDARLYGDAER